jgi:quercetin dioxygenase-like cupin family protein
MHVVRIADARPYTAAKHFDMRSLRLQGHDMSPAKGFWVGLSHFLPGGGAERDSTPIEKVYVVLAGEVTVITDSGETTLKPLDSCYLAPGEARAVENRSNLPASMLVVMPYPAGARA